MTERKTRNPDRKKGRCPTCLSWDVETIREGEKAGLRVCLNCGRMDKKRGMSRLLAL